jgi:uncharacterized integral membrane protein (TIGR00698 family)
MENETTPPEPVEQAPCTAPTCYCSEDWLAVWIGFLVIVLVMTGASFSLPNAKWTTPQDLVDKVLAASSVGRLVAAGGLLFALAAAGLWLMRGNLPLFAVGFPVVFLLAFVAQLIAGNARVSGWGLEYVIFALLLGLAISNTVGVPQWLREAVRTEFYIKTGLVILGACVLFWEILQAGVLGIVQALGVVTVVWFFCFWLCKKLRVDDEFAAMLSSAVSICGVSAAIATCGAIQGDQKKLSYVTSLVLIVALPMMIVMPWIVKTAGIPDVVGGAWLGGTLDTSGSVVAAGELISQPAMKAGVVVKFSQNVLIGLAAFLLSVWWAFKQQAATATRPTLRVIWERFPKFVLGFVFASVVFSFAIPHETAKSAKPLLEGYRNIWFAMAFTSIGLETRFSDLLKMGAGRPALAFIGAQLFNVVWTLLLAWLLFGGLLFPVPTFQ